ncbi:MAG: hypothetical protein ACLGHY_09855 [Gammaproteobacteria bacterium]
MEKVEIPTALSSFSLLVDPGVAMQAAQRLYAAKGQGLCHSGWLGRTVPLGSGALSRTEVDQDDEDDREGEDDSDDDR